MGKMNEMAVVLGRFGDEESTLFDRYERLSFEIQLNQAMLGRSLSEPSTLSGARGALSVAVAPPPPPPPKAHQVNQEGRRKLRFRKFLKKLLKPILGGGNGRPPARRKDASISHVQKDHRLWKTFSRSQRL